MKTIISFTIGLLSCVLIGCNGTAMETQETHAENVIEIAAETEMEKQTHRIAYGRYYTEDNGIIITNDGHEWWYSATEISKRETYDGMPVVVIFAENGTTEVEDDFIKGVVYDRETAIYDELEKEMQNEKWTVTRKENEIIISVE